MEYWGNVAYKPKYQSSPYISEKRTLGRPNRMAKRRNAFKLFVYIAVLAAIAFVLVGREVYISEQNNRVNELYEELANIEAINKQNSIKLEQSVDLANIEKVASENYDMARAEKHQMVYVNLPREDVAVKTADSSILDDLKQDFASGVWNIFGIFGAK